MSTPAWVPRRAILCPVTATTYYAAGPTSFGRVEVIIWSALPVWDLHKS